MPRIDDSDKPKVFRLFGQNLTVAGNSDSEGRHEMPNSQNVLQQPTITPKVPSRQPTSQSDLTSRRRPFRLSKLLQPMTHVASAMLPHSRNSAPTGFHTPMATQIRMTETQLQQALQRQQQLSNLLPQNGLQNALNQLPISSLVENSSLSELFRAQQSGPVASGRTQDILGRLGNKTGTDMAGIFGRTGTLIGETTGPTLGGRLGPLEGSAVDQLIRNQALVDFSSVSNSGPTDEDPKVLKRRLQGRLRQARYAAKRKQRIMEEEERKRRERKEKHKEKLLKKSDEELLKKNKNGESSSGGGEGKESAKKKIKESEEEMELAELTKETAEIRSKEEEIRGELVMEEITEESNLEDEDVLDLKGIQEEDFHEEIEEINKKRVEEVTMRGKEFMMEEKSQDPISSKFEKTEVDRDQPRDETFIWGKHDSIRQGKDAEGQEYKVELENKQVPNELSEIKEDMKQQKVEEDRILCLCTKGKQKASEVDQKN